MANDSAPWPYDFDRDRGIFTPRDRRFLAGELDEDFTNNELRQKRYQLRQRLIHAIQDLAYLRALETKDLFQVADEMEEMQQPKVDPTEESMEPARHRKMERIGDAIEESVALFYNISPLFQHVLGRQMAVQAALDHYDETGKYGVFEPHADVELIGEMSIEELREWPIDELNQIGKYYGWYEVLAQENENNARQKARESHPPTPEPEHPELVETVTEVIKDLNGRGAATDRKTVGETVAEREGVSSKKASEAVQDAFLAGKCYLDESEELKAV